MIEGDLMREIQIAASRKGARLFRNNVGVGRVSNDKKIRFGLFKGSSDLIGWTKDGKFLAVEVKTEKGILTKAQQRFLLAVIKAGGIGIVALSVDDLGCL